MGSGSGQWPGGGAGGTGGSGGPGGGGSGDGSGGGSGSGAAGTPGAGRPGGGKPWWRSSSRVALITAVIVAAVALTVFLTRPDGGTGSGEVFLQPAAAEGKDPFTKSTAKDSTAPASPTATPTAPSGDNGGTTSVEGSAPGLYGGSRSTPSCDVEKQIDFLRGEPAKAKAFAGVEGIAQREVPSYLRSLTPVQLRQDTRVTNHGFKDGEATAYQSVLQAGTAVLIDSRGVPRVRCACGNPLLPPVAVKETPKPVGKPWPAYQQSDVVAVQQSASTVNSFTLVDLDTGAWFKRAAGDETGKSDPPAPPPPATTPSDSPSPTCPPAESLSSTCPSTDSTSPAPSTPTPSPSTEPPTTSVPPDTSTPDSPSGPPQEEPGTTPELPPPAT
ncbi:DUF6777 domain-containing protein [Streptomyces violens]|uniref:DUF6777 domain-containing protein n=1 Tax=Streptomyces violens TaxID=66377 RepID=UPI000ABBD81A|nr:DUF6777 domain-containing protein [Streptomyces violens]